MRWLALIVLASCDVLDGDIEDKSNCCVFVQRSAVRACTAEFVERDWCQVWTCPTTHGYVCRYLDGGIGDPPDGWVPR